MGIAKRPHHARRLRIKSDAHHQEDSESENGQNYSESDAERFEGITWHSGTSTSIYQGHIEDEEAITDHSVVDGDNVGIKTSSDRIRTEPSRTPSR